jgi:hypothetical protein
LRASKAPETPSAPVVPLVPDPTRIAPVVRHRPNSKRCLAVDTSGVRRSSDRTKDGTTPLNGN